MTKIMTANPGTPSAVTTTATFAWDSTAAVPEVLDDATYSFVYGPDGQPIEQINDSTATPTYFVHDPLGSTRALLTSTGTIGATFTYNPYGTVTSKTGSSNTPLQYADTYIDARTGLDYAQHRYYDPTTGSFTSIDSLLDTTNQPYQYAGQDPVNVQDPSGQFSWSSALHVANLVYGVVSPFVKKLDPVADFKDVISLGVDVDYEISNCAVFGVSSARCQNSMHTFVADSVNALLPRLVEGRIRTGAGFILGANDLLRNIFGLDGSRDSSQSQPSTSSHGASNRPRIGGVSNGPASSTGLGAGPSSVQYYSGGWCQN